MRFDSVYNEVARYQHDLGNCVCVFVCLCVCAHVRERERESQEKRVRFVTTAVCRICLLHYCSLSTWPDKLCVCERESVRACKCVCVCAREKKFGL